MRRNPIQQLAGGKVQYFDLIALRCGQLQDQVAGVGFDRDNARTGLQLDQSGRGLCRHAGAGMIPAPVNLILAHEAENQRHDARDEKRAEDDDGSQDGAIS